MHLLSSYSLQSGQIIRRPQIVEKFFPLNIEKYIVLQPVTKNAKTYDHFQIVCDLLFPILQKHGISILQIGLKDEPSILGCHNLCGQTTINQCFYLVRNSMLVLGSDSFALHAAGFYNIPLVGLYSTNFIENVGPYWGNKDKQILLEPNRKNGLKPSFSVEEHPKQINTIEPERVVKSVLKLLNIPYKQEFKSISIGETYKHRILETVPDQAVDLRQFNIDCIIVRLDLIHNENALIMQLQNGPCSIVTCKPITDDILVKFRANIKEIIYFVGEDGNVEFIDKVQKLGLRFVMMSDLPTDKLNEQKLKFLDYGLIIHKPITKPEVLKDKDLSKIYYLSNKNTLSQGKSFMSHAAYLKNIPADGKPQQIIDTPEFYKECEYFYLIEKIN